MHYQFPCAPKLARKYDIEHWSRASKTVNWSADRFKTNHVTSMSWHKSPRYGHVIMVSGYPVLTSVNWPYCECLFESLPYSTRTICRRVRTLGQSRDNQTKRGWPYSMSMEPRYKKHTWKDSGTFFMIIIIYFYNYIYIFLSWIKFLSFIFNWKLLSFLLLS